MKIWKIELKTKKTDVKKGKAKECPQRDPNQHTYFYKSEVLLTAPRLLLILSIIQAVDIWAHAGDQFSLSDNA